MPLQAASDGGEHEQSSRRERRRRGRFRNGVKAADFGNVLEGGGSADFGADEHVARDGIEGEAVGIADISEMGAGGGNRVSVGVDVISVNGVAERADIR